MQNKQHRDKTEVFHFDFFDFMKHYISFLNQYEKLSNLFCAFFS